MSSFGGFVVWRKSGLSFSIFIFLLSSSLIILFFNKSKVTLTLLKKISFFLRYKSNIFTSLLILIELIRLINSTSFLFISEYLKNFCDKKSESDIFSFEILIYELKLPKKLYRV